MFKIAFGWGLRRRELAMLDVCDFRPDARLPEFGGYAQVHVRHGKSKRGGGPQRRTVLSVFDGRSRSSSSTSPRSGRASVRRGIRRCS